MRRTIAFFGVLIIVGLILTGCGGGNQAPTVEITKPKDQSQAMSKRVSFEVKGQDKDLPSGKQLKYSWDFGDGTTEETQAAKIEHTYKAPGSYTVKVVAIDDKGKRSEEAKITITVENALPQAEARATPTKGQAPLTVEFDASASADPDGKITRYEWDFGDGTKGSGAKVRHEYAEPGNYTIKLTVADEDGATAAKTLAITVEAASQAGLWEVRMISTEDGRQIFEPALLKIKPGDTVRWVLASGVHTTTAYSEENGKAQGIPEGAPSWDSGVLTGQGEAFEFTFPEDAPQGSYAYFCIPHESLGMVGLLVVGEFTGLSEEFLNSLPPAAKAELEKLIEEAKKL